MAQTLRKRIVSFWPLIAITVGSLLLYLYRLDFVPVHLNQDELEFSLNAYSISKTLHDSYGNFLPFYFWHLGSFWATPIIVYLTAIFLKFLPISEATIRLPSVFIGALSIALIMVLTNQIFKDRRLTIVSGILAATTPALFVQSRLLLDNLYVVPFVLLWLIFIHRYSETRQIGYLFLSGLSLGIGFHSYHAAKVMMPIYYIASLFYCYVSERKINLKALFIFTLGFLIPILVFIPWLREYPDTLTNQISYVSSIDKSIDYKEGIFGVLNPSRISLFASSYLTYLGPGILFFTGDRSLIHSTQTTGAFLFPLIFLLVFGILSVIFVKKGAFSRLILFGFLTYPIAPALINDPQRISRGLVAIVFVIILSTYGVEYLINFKDRALRGLLLAILVVSVFQFASFLSYYFGDYRKASYGWFNNDIGGALESGMRSTKIRNVDSVYVDKYIYFIERYALFYQAKLGVDLDGKLRLFDYTKEDFSTLPKGSLVVLQASHVGTRANQIGRFEKIETIREPDGNESFYIFYRGIE